MANARLPQLAIKANQLKQQDIEFTPFNLQIEPINFDALERGFAKSEQREKETIKDVNAVLQSLGNARGDLYQDPSNINFINDKINNANAQINERISLGDYDGAMKVSNRLARELATDQELNDRLNASKAFKPLLEKVNNMSITSTTKNWWKETHPFRLIPKVDSNGNQLLDANGKPVYDTDFSTYNLPESEIDIAAWYQAAANLVEESSNSVSNQKTTGNSTDVANSYQKSDGSSNSTSSGSGYNKTTSSSKTTHVKRAEDILAVLNNNIERSPAMQAQLSQAYEVYKWKTKKQQQKLDELTTELLSYSKDGIVGVYVSKEDRAKAAELKQQIDDIKAEQYRFYKNGSPVSSKKEYLEMMIDNNILQNSLAYNRQATSNSSSYTTSSRNSKSIGEAPENRGGGSGITPIEYTDKDGNTIRIGGDGTGPRVTPPPQRNSAAPVKKEITGSSNPGAAVGEFHMSSPWNQ